MIIIIFKDLNPIMGNASIKQQCIVPEKAYRVISVSRNDVALQLNLLTDYVISPHPKNIDYRKDSVIFQIYSSLDENIRSVDISVENRQLGFQLKLQSINNAMLRITKIFEGSPLHKHNVQSNQFIVGVVQGYFSNIKSFAQLIKDLINSKTFFTLGICNNQGKTRLIQISVVELKQWYSKGYGLLGCELAEGWIHKFKSQKNHSLSERSSNMNTTGTSARVNQMQPIIAKGNEGEGRLDFQIERQIDEKCNSINRKYSKKGILEYKFRGNYKKEQIIDASVVCKCRPMSLDCEKCFMQKEGSFHFYNKKTSRIICMPYNFMMSMQPSH